jgi:kynurenine formamidase
MRTLPRILFAATLAVAWTAAAEQPKSPLPVRRVARPDLRTATVVDLTHPFDSSTLYWPTSPTKFELTTLTSGMTEGGWFYSANSFCAPEHGGTHMDAPIHFGRGQKTADQIGVRQLVAPAVVIDVSESAASDPDYRLSPADVRRWEKRHGTIPGGAIVLLRTGWSKRWPDRKRYFGDDTPGDASNLHFPSFGAEAVGFLLHDRRVSAIGVDTASIDHGPSKDFPVHRLAAEANVPGLENLDALESLPESGAWVVALPMKIAGGSGAPLRAIALVP